MTYIIHYNNDSSEYFDKLSRIFTEAYIPTGAKLVNLEDEITIFNYDFSIFATITKIN